MEIKADKAGLEALTQLLDIALKQGGIANLNAINTIAQAIKPTEEDEPLTEEEVIV